MAVVTIAIKIEHLGEEISLRREMDVNYDRISDFLPGLSYRLGRAIATQIVDTGGQ